MCVPGKISTPYITSSALNSTLINTHGSLTLRKFTQNRRTDMATVLCMGANSSLLDEYLAFNSSLTPEELQPRRRRKRNKREETRLPEVYSPRGRPNRQSLAMWEGRCLLTGPAAQMSLHRTEVCAQSSSETVQSSSYSQHVPVTPNEESALPHTTSTTADCFTAGPETVSAHSLNLLKLLAVSAMGFGNGEEKRT